MDFPAPRFPGDIMTRDRETNAQELSVEQLDLVAGGTRRSIN